MTATEIEPELQAMLDEEVALWRGKGDEYTIGRDRLYNFTSVAEKLGMTPMQVWSVYFLKHVYAVLAFAKSGKEGMEGIESRLADIAVYAKLGRLIVRSMKPSGVGAVTVYKGKPPAADAQLSFDFSDMELYSPSEWG